MDYPRLMYRSASVTLGVADEAARHAALKDGWFDSVPEALAGKSKTPPAPSGPVTVFKRNGVKVESHRAKDQAEADALIAGDGWHPTQAAAIATAWPAPDAIPAFMESLGKRPAKEIADYAATLGLSVGTNEKPANLLARIETKLLTGPVHPGNPALPGGPAHSDNPANPGNPGNSAPANPGNPATAGITPAAG